MILTPDIRSDYLYSALNPSGRKRIIKQLLAFLRPHVNSFDVIAFCGMSGALIAPIVADTLKKGIILVRKESDGHTHSVERIEGVASMTRYVIIDDFVFTGDTVTIIMEQIRDKRMAKNLTPLFVCVYARYASRETDWPLQLTGGLNLTVKVHGVMADVKFAAELED